MELLTYAVFLLALNLLNCITTQLIENREVFPQARALTADSTKTVNSKPETLNSEKPGRNSRAAAVLFHLVGRPVPGRRSARSGKGPARPNRGS